MKILFVSPSNTIGGAEMSLLHMVKWLHSQGHTVFVALPPAHDKSYEQQLQPFIQAFLFVPLMAWNRVPAERLLQSMKGWIYRLYKSRGGWLHAPFRIARFVRRHKIDLIHTNTILALDGAFAAAMAGVPHIQHLREITGYGPDALFSMPWQRQPERFTRYWSRWHAGVIANSYYTQQAYWPYLNGVKSQVIYNTVELECPKTEKKTRRTPTTIGLVANVTSKVKNHQLFIQIAGRLSEDFPQLKFVIFGKLPHENDPYLQGLRKVINEKKLNNKLIFKGVCTDIPDMYAQMDLLVHTCSRESFGRVFIEAMACGVPVVAVQGGGSNELIRHGETGFLFADKAPEMAVRYIKNLIEDQDLYHQIAGNGKKSAEQYRSATTGAALLDLYATVVPAPHVRK